MAGEKTLSIVITGDTKSAQDAISRFKAELKTLDVQMNQVQWSKMKDGVASISTQLDSLKNSFMLISGAAGTLMATIQMVVMPMAKLVETADQMNDMAQKIGIGVRELAKYELAARQSGTSMEAIAKGVKSLSGNLLEHGDAFKSVGINAKDADSAMKQLADMFAAMPDGILKTTLATKVFGKAGMDLIPMLNLGAKGLEEAEKRSAKYADQMAKLAPLSDKFNDTMAELATNAKVGGMAILNDLLPPFNDLIKKIADAQLAGNGLFASLLAGLNTSSVFGPGIGERSLDDLRERAASLQGTISWIEGLKRTSASTGSSVGFVFEGKLKASVAELKILQTEIADRLKQLRGFQGAVREVDNAIAATGRTAQDSIKKGGDLLKKLGGEDDAKKAKDAYDTLMQSIQEKLALKSAEVEAGRKLTEGEKLRIELLGKLSQLQKVSGLDRSQAEWMINYLAKLKDATAETERLKKAQEEWTKFVVDSLKPLDEQAAKIEQENQRFNKTEGQIQREIAARLDDAAAMLAQNKAKRILEGATQEEIDLAEKNISYYESLAAARRRIAEASDQKDTLEATKKALEEQAREWQKFTDDIESALTDSLMRGFESGKGFGQNFVDSLKNMLKTAALKVVVQALVDPVMGSFKTAVMGTAAGNVAGTAFGSGLAGSAMGATLIGGNSSFGALNAVGSGITYLGNAVGSSTISSFGMGWQWGGMGTSMAGATGGSAAAASAGATAAAAAPYVVATLAAMKVLGVFDGGGPKTGGDARFSGGAIGDWNSGWGFFTENQANSTMATSMQTFMDGLKTTINKLGGKMASDLQVAFGASSDPQGTAPDRIAALVNAKGRDYLQQSTEVARGSGQTELTNQLNRVMIAALQASELPAWAKTIVDAVNPATASVDQLGAALTALDNTMAAINNAEAARKDMLYSLLTPTEQLAKAHQDLASAGIPETIAGFRSMAEGLDLTSTAGQETFAKMLNLKGAFDLIQQSAVDTTNATTAAARSMADIANERQSLQDQLDELTLSSTAMLTKQRNALDESNRALFDQVTTAKDAKLAADALAESQARIANERQSLRDQLDELTLSNAELLTKQRNALDESNRALFDQVTTAKDAKQAADALAASQAKIAQERQSLQDQFDQLTLSNTDLLAKQRDSLDESNRALFDQINAAKAAAQAEQDLAAAREKALQDAQKAVQEAYASVQRAVESERSSVTAAYNAAVAEQNRQIEASKAAVQGAWETLQRSVAADRDAITANYNTAMEAANARLQVVTETVAKLGNLSSALRNTLQTLQPMNYTQARDQIGAALASVRAGGELPSLESLTQALQTVTKQDSSRYASLVDMQRDNMRVSSDIAQLGDLTDQQVGIQQKTLDAAKTQIATIEDGFKAEGRRLDNLLATAQHQINVFNGVNDSVIGVSTAVNRLNTAINASTIDANKAQIDLLNAGFRSEMTRLDNILTTALRQYNAAMTINDSVLKVFDAVGLLGDAIRTLNNLPKVGTPSAPSPTSTELNKLTVQNLYLTYAQKTTDQIDARGLQYWTDELLTKPYADVSKAFQDSVKAVRGYADGGMHPGGLRIVGENGPELETTGAARIYNMDQMREILRGGDMNAKLEEMRKEFILLRRETVAILKNIDASSSRTAKATNGAPDSPILVEVAA